MKKYFKLQTSNFKLQTLVWVNLTLFLILMSCSENVEIPESQQIYSYPRSEIVCGCSVTVLDNCCVRLSCDLDGVYYSIGVDGCGGLLGHNYGVLTGGAPGVDICSPCGGNVIVRTWAAGGRCDDFDTWDISVVDC